MAENNSSSVVLSAIGALIGHFGAGMASESMFSRLLFPTRFYNPSTTSDILGITFLLPLGGPMHKAALQTLDRFISNGLFLGYCCGSMLGTAFLDDVQQKYYLVDPTRDAEDLKDARNILWYRVFEVLPWRMPLAPLQIKSNDSQGKDAPPSEQNAPLRSVKPFLHLRLEYDDEKTTIPQQRLSTVRDDLGPVTWRVGLAVSCSEVVAIIIGLCMALVWRSPFSLWFGCPIILKIVALLFRVRRQGLDVERKSFKKKENPQTIMAQFEHSEKGVLLIEGPPGLVMQFFRHYGHPERSRQGINGDRPRELISISSVVACMMIFPAGLVAFAFAPPNVKLTWTCYQLYTTLALLIYRVGGGNYVETTEKQLAQKLYKERAVRFEDGQGASIIACARTDLAHNITELQTMVEERKKEFRSKQQTEE